MFSNLPTTNFNFLVTLILSSANALNWDKSEILSFCSELKDIFVWIQFSTSLVQKPKCITGAVYLTAYFPLSIFFFCASDSAHFSFTTEIPSRIRPLRGKYAAFPCTSCMYLVILDEMWNYFFLDFQCFQNGFFFRVVKSWDCVVKSKQQAALTLHTIPIFNDHEKENFWKHCRKKGENVTSIFSFANNVFYPSQNKFQLFSNIILSAKFNSLNLDLFKIFVVY